MRLDFIRSLRFPSRAAWKTLGIILLLLMLVYYPLGTLFITRIDDNTELPLGAFDIPGGSHAVATAQALVDREVNQHHWTPNDPLFYPTGMMVRMPAYQRGIISAVARFTIELADQIGRTRGTSQIDPEVQNAIGHFNYSPTVWFYDTSISYLPTPSSETQYRAGIKSLNNYNARLASGQTALDMRADNLMATIERIAADIGSSSAALDAHVQDRGALSLWDSAELYYFTKGKMAAYYYLLKGMREDFKAVIGEKELGKAYDQMLYSLEEGMVLRPYLVFNAAPDTMLMPSHLAAQGFYLMRARTQMYEVANILLK